MSISSKWRVEYLFDPWLDSLWLRPQGHLENSDNYLLEDVFALLYYEEDILYEYLSRYLVVIDTVYT